MPWSILGFTERLGDQVFEQIRGDRIDAIETAPGRYNDVIATLTGPANTPLMRATYRIVVEQRQASVSIGTSTYLTCPSLAELPPDGPTTYGTSLDGSPSRFLQTFTTAQFECQPEPAELAAAARWCSGPMWRHSRGLLDETDSIDALQNDVDEIFARKKASSYLFSNDAVHDFILYCLLADEDERAERANREVLRTDPFVQFGFQGFLAANFPGRLPSVPSP